MAGKLNLDKLDLQIIQAMMENAEVSYAELGKKLYVMGVPSTFVSKTPGV